MESFQTIWTNISQKCFSRGKCTLNLLLLLYVLFRIYAYQKSMGDLQSGQTYFREMWPTIYDDQLLFKSALKLPLQAHAVCWHTLPSYLVIGTKKSWSKSERIVFFINISNSSYIFDWQCSWWWSKIWRIDLHDVLPSRWSLRFWC